MKVTVDKSVCVLTGNCLHAADGVFRMGEVDLEYDDHPSEEHYDRVREAALYCPVQAITIEEETS